MIITLAMGSVFDGIAAWLPNQLSIPGISPKLAEWTVGHHILGIPLDFWYGIGIMLIMFYVLTFTPFGQRALFIGQSREVARLSGFKVGSTRFWGFVVAGFIAAIAGVLNDGVLGTATPQRRGEPAAGGLCGGLPRLDDDPARTLQRYRCGHFRVLPAVAVNGMNLLGAQTTSSRCSTACSS